MGSNASTNTEEEEEALKQLLEKYKKRTSNKRRTCVLFFLGLHYFPLGPFEKMNGHFGHQKLANDPKQCQKDDEPGKRLRRTVLQETVEFGWPGEEDNPGVWIEQT